MSFLSACSFRLRYLRLQIRLSCIDVANDLHWCHGLKSLTSLEDLSIEWTYDIERRHSSTLNEEVSVYVSLLVKPICVALKHSRTIQTVRLSVSQIVSYTLDRDAIRAKATAKRTSTTPPAPRLVGVEPNPGPTVDVPHRSIIDVLYRDVVSIVLSFLDVRDLHRAGCTCRVWSPIAISVRYAVTSKLLPRVTIQPMSNRLLGPNRY